MARKALRRIVRPFEVRQLAREQQVLVALRTLEARLAHLEAHREADLSMGQNAAAAVTALVGRVDELERRVERAAVLARPGLDELELFPGRRIVKRFGDMSEGDLLNGRRALHGPSRRRGVHLRRVRAQVEMGVGRRRTWLR